MFAKHFARRRCATALVATALFGLAAAASAQDKPAGGDVAQANNPLASFTAFNVHDYYMGELTQSNGNANQAWARYAQPFSIGDTRWLMRASLPFNSFPVAPTMERQNGVGDLNVLAALLIDIGNPAVTFGIGPQITAPTASQDVLGSGKWSAGLMNNMFNASSRVFQYGYLLTWQGSFAGADDRAKVSMGAFQPFLFYQLGGGTYLRSSGVMSYNFVNNTYSVPIGFGIGQVIPKEKVVYNLFIEPQVSVADKGAGWAKWQILAGINTQFK